MPRFPFLPSLFLLVVLLLTSLPHAVLAAPVDVCIDPGHSLSEPGAVNAGFNIREVDINLEVSKRVGQLLTAAGRSSVYTWHTDPGLAVDNTGDPNSSQARATICNNAQSRLVVSIHTNSVADPNRDGTWVGYHGKESKPFAAAIRDRMWNDLFVGSSWEAGATLYRLEVFANGVLIWTDAPSVLVEPLFLSHPGEAAALQTALFDGGGAACSDCRREQIAQSIAAGLKAELDKLDSGGGGGGNCPPGKKNQGKC